MKTKYCALIAAVLQFGDNFAFATQADDTTITIIGQTPGATPFINQLTLSASDTSVIKSIRFTIAPKPGSVARALSAVYSADYLTDRGDLIPGSGQIFLPVYGLYSDYANTVALTYDFLDGSSKGDSTTITTGAYNDSCNSYNSPTVHQPRTASTSLSYDYMFLKGCCPNVSPPIIDSDGALRWVASIGDNSACVSGFFFNSVYFTSNAQLWRVDLDGTVSLIAPFTGLGIVSFHHNLDLGKNGILVEPNFNGDITDTTMEVSEAGEVIKTWNMADIVSDAMVAGGDDPSQFVVRGADWFHENSATYNRADDSLIVSSRENFLICVDYETAAIKWIFGDPTKHWHDFPSLAQFAIDVPPGAGVPPIGQHSISITDNQEIMVFDNGYESVFQQPPGATRGFASPRRYRLDLTNKTATEVFNYEMDQNIYSPICGSVYEDSPSSYLVDYADVNGFLAEDQFAELLGILPDGEPAFFYQYPTSNCEAIFAAQPIHLESTAFPAVGPQMLNLSTRGLVGMGDTALIGGFIVTGEGSHTIILRALGPSLSGSGLSTTVADPVLTLFDAAGNMVARNDDWGSDPGASQIAADGLAPVNSAESATLQTLTPGEYTFVVTGKDPASPGIGLIEAYDLSPLLESKLANLSTRGMVGVGDEVLISGFIVGQVEKSTVAVRALGPSLASAGVEDALADPSLTVYDANGAAITTNDDWQDDLNVLDIEQNGLAPADDSEAATILYLPAGAYTTVVTGSDGTTGVSLIELYNLL